MMIEKIVIIGGGQASLSCASQLRFLGFKGGICMICEENYYPYQRLVENKERRTLLSDIQNIILTFH